MGMEGETCQPALGEKDKAWGKVASNVPDPPKCIENCRARFLEEVVQGYDGSKFAQVCGILSDGKEAANRLWDLYCCDSMVCGVQLNGKPDLGQDPGVNLIINTCQNIGSATVQDPGPPPLGYSCSAITPAGDPDSLACQRPFLISDTRPLPAPTAISSLLSASFPMAASTSPTVLGSSTRPAHSAVGTAGATVSHEQRQAGLPLGSRVAIGVSCAAALLAILAAALCCFRRRSRHGYTQSIKSAIKHHTLPPASSPTPLISSATSMREVTTAPLPMTPPPRLKERRMLPTLLTPTTTRISSAASFGGSSLGTPTAWSVPSFPQAPIYAPTSSKLPPRFDRSTKPLGYPPLPSVYMGKTTKTASMSSAASARTATTVSQASSGFPYLTPSSPSRPPRPHDVPLRIPDLVCPGPPPTRALPPAPPVSPVSPVSLFRQQQADGIGVAIGPAGFIPPRNPARGVVLGKESRDFCELTESCARESRERDSWGSWSVGAGGTGIGSSSVQKGGAGRVSSPVLEEADLERLGGRY